MTFRTLWLSILIAFATGVNGQNSIKDIQSASGQTFSGKPDSLRQGWTVGALLGLTFAQASSSNWAAGAQDFTMSLNTADNFWAFYKKGRVSWDNTLTANYGFTNTTDLGLQKSSDLFDLLSRYGYQLDSGKWFISAMFDFRSQFTNGYNYYKNQQGKDSNQLISQFMAPAYILLSPGVQYKPKDWFSLFLSPVSARWIVSTNKTLAPSFGIDTGKSVLFQFGAFASAIFNKSIAKNVVYTARLDLYSNYLKNFGDIDVYSTNQIAMKVNKVLTATYNLNIIYDDNARRPNGTLWGTQFQSILGIGLAVKL
ncbi:DUF3078 domain-containing protein [Dinghuibacter silviterrae]|uniref:DUF3078 family protein n=1 Tax=Dinghuibacter silviterrae TaxID=1539049 RepID=A0A4R8DPR7_9BACT|nr:DUF3078 domain-containing protein [Dinghuibacter silviterrae]TDW99404.1 DUF3078 family protein [Dinghuibacter silviterrae]